MEPTIIYCDYIAGCIKINKVETTEYWRLAGKA